MSEASDQRSSVAEPRRSSLLAGFFVGLVKKPLGTVGAAIVLLLLLAGVLAPLLATHDVNRVELRDKLAPPSAQHLLGADHLGRDTFSRLILAARVSVIVGLAATSINMIVAGIIGGLSGFLGGKFDVVMQRFVDAFYSFPDLLLLLTIMAIAGRGLVQVTVVLGTLYGIYNSRIVRSAVIDKMPNSAFCRLSRRK